MRSMQSASMPSLGWQSTRSCLQSDSLSNRSRSHSPGSRACRCIEYSENEQHICPKGSRTMAIQKSGIRLAKRLDEVGFSDIVQIRNKVMGMRAEGLHVHALHGGEPYFETPEEIKFAAVKALVENQTHYAPSSGLLPLRNALVEKLAAKNAINVTTDEVIATVRGS